MELIADIKHFRGDDALQWVASACFDGRLVFQRSRLTVALSLRRGRIASCESSDPLLAFSQHLFAKGLADGLDLATARQRAKPERIGETLVEMGVLTPAMLAAATAEHNLDLACSVVTWEDGVVAAHATPITVADPDFTPLDPLFVSMEAALRSDELERIREVIPHDLVELAPGEERTLGDPTPSQSRILDLLGEPQTVEELYARVGGCRFAFLKNVFDLIALDRIACGSAGPPPRPDQGHRISLVDVLLDSDLDRRLRA